MLAQYCESERTYCKLSFAVRTFKRCQTIIDVIWKECIKYNNYMYVTI